MTPAPRRIVIVGGGIAGVTAGDALRDAGFEGELTVVGAEAHRAYSRPALSKAALHDLGDLTGHLLPEPAHGAVERLGVAAVGLDAERRLVRLEGGEELPYDGLVIASGSRARRLGRATADAPAGEHGAGAAPGTAAPGTVPSAELTLRGLDDAVELRRRIAGRPDVIVIGGGALAMEVASGCAAAGCRVTLVSRRTPQEALLGAHLAGFLAERAVEAGVELRCAGDVELVDGGDGARVILRGGAIPNEGSGRAGEEEAVLEAPLVVAAIGDEPNVEWLRGSGLLGTGDGPRAGYGSAGLRADSRGRIAPGVVAAGDVAAFPHRGGHRRLPLWTSAIEQAKVAARALLHGDDALELDFQPYFWTEQWGIGVKACGELPLAGDPEVLQGDLAERSALLRWGDPGAGTATAVAVGLRMPIPRLRALTR